MTNGRENSDVLQECQPKCGEPFPNNP
jgi:hypothetical protein